MNVLLILLLAVVALAAGYVFYGRMLAKKWNIGAHHETPAMKYYDNTDYIPTRKEIIFSHQFASVADGGLITGTIQAAVFGWVPVLLWLVLGAIFVGGVQDLAALCTSVRNRGRTIGSVIEQYIGKWGKRLFLGYAWLCAVLVIGAFVDMLSRTYCGIAEGGNYSYTGGQVTSVTLILMVMTLFFGLLNRFGKMGKGAIELVSAIIVISAVMLGMMFPVYFRTTNWYLILFVYLLLASSLPVWLLTQPRNVLNTRIILVMLVMLLVGLFVRHPNMQLEAFRGFSVDGQPLFPYLFATGACGAVSGYHTLVASATTSKMIRSERRILPVAYGSMLLAALLAIVVLLAMGGVNNGEQLSSLDPIAVLPGTVAVLLNKLGLPETLTSPLVSFGVCTLILSTLDALARTGRVVWQELLLDSEVSRRDQPRIMQILTNNYVATAVTVLPAIGVAMLGYKTIWPIFGNANLMISAVTLLMCEVFFRKTKHKSAFLRIPMALMLAFTLFMLVRSGWLLTSGLFSGASVSVLSDLLQLLLVLAACGIAAYISVQAFKQLLAKEETANQAE